MKTRKYIKFPLAARIAFRFIRILIQLGQQRRILKVLAKMAPKRFATTFEGYSPTENDIIIATLSRSGTNWMMQMTLQIIHYGAAEFEYIYDHIAWPSFVSSASIPLNETPPPSPTGYRIIKTQIEAEHVPINDVTKYITVIRDPKDFLVSVYHFVPQVLSFIGMQPVTPDEWLAMFLKGETPGGTWAEHTAGWWELRDKPNVFIVTFNELKADMDGNIDRVADFLGVTLTPEQRAVVIEKSSFDYMKNINHKFSPVFNNTPSLEVIREGKSGGGKKLFSQEQLDQIDSHCKQRLQALGSDFPYDEYFGKI